MDGLLTYVFAVFGVVVPVVAFLWEFVLSGRKRLGYRVQVNDPVRTSGDSAEEAAQLGVLQQLLPKKAEDGSKPAKLGDMSIVLLKIENNGWTEVGHEDYRHSEGANSGITFRFPGRTIVGVALTAPSRSMKSVLRDHTSGVKTDLDGSDGLIVLPKFALGREDSYKIMAVLRRHPDMPKYSGDELPLPEVDGGIRRGKVIRTESRTRMSTPYAALVTLLVAVVIVQFVTGLVKPHSDPMDCEAGHLSLTGSTAIEKVMQDSAAGYQRRCPGAHIDATGFKSSNDGLQTLDSGKQADPATQLAFTDGLNTDHPALVARPIAFVLFTPVVNAAVTGFDSLTRQQIADLYAGRYLNWKDLGGPDLAVRLIGRHRSSGSRSAFEHEILEGDEPADNSADCHTGAAPEPLRCEADTTADLLTLVARTPGAIGYSEVATATADSRIRVLEVDGHRATRDEALAGTYHFGASEYAYSVGALPPDSLAAGFLRYLGFGEGKDILSRYGDAPCAELADPVDCRPYR
ncbi:substrate-binding domain-containing protein [Nocardia sp. BMG111209]|uniref:substrate-binding domain-containing protein n=1 Tax=Nocardia sp. BMG111209 TaxID=1160137 RepID=UPI0003A88B08|nr:substrate-binding domain-containing protein [Nocardia sp. BMG111209]